MNGTILAHTDGSVPNLMVYPRNRTSIISDSCFILQPPARWQGNLYPAGVNPFNQPGVESYKKNMFALLGKPGFEKKGGTAEAVIENMEDYKMDFEALQLKRELPGLQRETCTA